MGNKRNNRGFTLAEVLIVVAILAILAGVSFIAVIRHQRSMEQLEMDGVAKEIFVAAQNHLSLASSQGYLGRDDFGTAEEEDGKATGVYYYIVGDSYAELDKADSVLGLMLPIASVDETVRMGGSYIIRYQTEPALVLDVFFAQKGGQFGHTFSTSEYDTLMQNYRDDVENKISRKEARKSYGDAKAVIGWYGGKGVVLEKGEALEKPTLTVTNADRLSVTVTNPNASNAKAGLKLIVTGATSGASQVFTLIDSEGTLHYGTDKAHIEVVLDDITSPGSHFKLLCPALIPGEDIIIQAVADNNQEASNIAYSAEKVTNSLFASLDGETAGINNIRHLENLSNTVSGVNETGTKAPITGAKQLSDLSWSALFENGITKANGSELSDCYYPVDPVSGFAYDGQGHAISGLTISNSTANAGVFGSLSGGSVANLKLDSFKVSGANAGALAGAASGTSFSNILVYNKAANDADFEIKGSGSTGGLVGSLSGGSVTNCAAAVYVSSSGGEAGGLVGKAEGSAVISMSYAGGHTKDGSYTTLSSGAGRLNVTGVTAGGLVGSFSGSKIENSYSTCSVSGTTAAGGLVGSLSGGSVSTAYCTGIVAGPEGGRGAFAGSVSNGASVTGSSYLDVINPGLNPGTSGVSAQDNSIDQYTSFVKTEDRQAAHPHDAQLVVEYKGGYYFPTVGQLSGAADTGVTREHYGDWPSPETKIVNTKTVSGTLSSYASGPALRPTLLAAGGEAAYVSYTEAAGLPEGTQLMASEIPQDSVLWESYVSDAAEAVGADLSSLADARVLDLSLVSEGETVEPEGSVSVALVLDGLDVGDVSVVLLGEEPEVVDAEVNGSVVTFEAESSAVYAIVTTVLEKTLEAGDGNLYRVSVTYTSAAGIPDNAELVVREIAASEDYDSYVASGAAVLGTESDKLTFARVFDITLLDPVTGETYQPNRDVKVSIELLDTAVEAADKVDVVHFGETLEALPCEVSGSGVDFETNGFSVYVVIGHEGGEIITPRVEFHYLDSTFTEDAENAGLYRASRYPFVNKAGTTQYSQIVKSGESLEMISNPANQEYTIENEDGTTSTVSKYFFGWYMVSESSEESETGTVAYRWETDPELIGVEDPVTIEAVWNDARTALTSLTWTMNGVSHEVKASDNTEGRIVLDATGCAHVWLAPIYEDYFFINFHLGALNSGLEDSLLVRRLVVLGSDGTAEIRIGDVAAPSLDANHHVFTGWESNLWDVDSHSYEHSTMTTLDDVGEELLSGEGKDGFYLQVHTEDFAQSSSVDLYPIFTEARWIKFNTGKSGNGATYVADQYLYTSETVNDKKYFLTDLSVPSRTGYIFKGWYADVSETDLNGDYIDGIQITDENGHIVSGPYTKYKDAENIIPLYMIEDGRLYIYKNVDIASGVTFYAHWEEVTDAPIQIIIWRQKVSDSKNAYDYQKTYDFEASYTVDTTSGLTLNDLRVNNVLRNGTTKFEELSFTGFHYRTTEMNTARVAGDGSTVVNVYYDRDLMTMYFYYNGTGEPAYTYTETTGNNPEEQYGIVEGEYVRLTRKQGSGVKYTFRYAYTPTASDTITPQYALMNHGGNVWTYDELTREVNTVTNTRWSFKTGRRGKRTTRYMDQGVTNGVFYVYDGWSVWYGTQYKASSYTVDNPPPADSSETYYCYYNYDYYELTEETTRTTTYTWKLDGVNYGGTRYRRYAGTEEYTGSRYTISGRTDTFGVDSRGGYVELDGTPVDAYSWYTTTHSEEYTKDDTNTGVEKDVYGLVDGEYVQLTPTFGNDYSYQTEHTYTATTATNTAQPKQYGIVDGEYVELNWGNVGTITALSVNYVYTPISTSSSGDYFSDYYYYISGNGSSFSSSRWSYLYYSNGAWYDDYRLRDRDYLANTIYTRTTNNNSSLTYNGTTYRLSGGEFVEYSGTSYTLYGFGEDGVIYQLGNQVTVNRTGWRDSSFTEYTGTRFLQSDGASWNGGLLTRIGDAAPYTYTPFTGSPSAGQVLYAEDGNQNGADNPGHVKLNWNVSVTGYTYEDADGNTKSYSGDRYTLGVTEIETEYTGTRYTRAALSAFTNMKSYTGLYGQTLAQCGYVWPDSIDDTSFIWYSGYSISWGRISYTGSRLTFLDAFLFSDLEYATNNNTVIKLYGNESTQSGTFVYFYQQNLDGTYPAVGLSTSTNHVATTSGNTFTITNKYPGFNAVSYSTNGGSSWTTGGVDTSVRISTSGLHIRFQRNSYELIFEPNYPTLAGTSVNGTALTLDNLEEITAANRVTLPVKYEEPLSNYASQPQPENAPDNYTFGGWYVDATCTVPYTFGENMPAANMRLFAKWNPVTFRVMIDPNGGQIDHIDHRGRVDYEGLYGITIFSPERLGNTYNRSAATYVNVVYNESLSEYNLQRDYVEISDAAAELMDKNEVFYYLNTQYKERDGSGLPTDLRNALYITEDEFAAYHEYYRSAVEWNRINLPGSFVGMDEALDLEAWKDAYLAKNENGGLQKYRAVTGSEHYTFLGWYRLDENGNPESMPYNFADPVVNDLRLRAYWRLDGGYQLQYSPEFIMDDGTIINGSIPAWTDPEEQTARYTDQATTHIYRQPTGITANGEATENYIFRGWRLVNIRSVNGVTVSTPIEPGVYYDPGDLFIIRAANADQNSILHLQAVYEEKDSSYRRPAIANLTLNANTGYLTDADGAELTANRNLDWNGIGTVSMDAAADQIDFGDIQSNTAVHLYRYATKLTEDASGNSISGTNYFKHTERYYLLGFDDAPDEGDFIASYPADSVITAQRKDSRTIYAVWEPMVYLNIVNDTQPGHGDITLSLSSTDGSALTVVNEKKGAYDRVRIEDIGSITVKQGETLSLAIPNGADKSITISGTSGIGTGYMLYWETDLNGVKTGHPSGSVENLGAFTLTDTLRENETEEQKGLTVTFTSEKADNVLILDENWSEGHVSEAYFSSASAETNYIGNPYKLPSTSTRLAYQFLGWSRDPNATTAEFSSESEASLTITPSTLFTGGETTVTLYAVWDPQITANTVRVYKAVPEPGNQEKEFTFTFGFTGRWHRRNYSTQYSFNSSPSTASFTLSHGEYLVIETNKSLGGNSRPGTMTSTIQKYSATGEIIGTETTLSWTNGNNNEIVFDSTVMTLTETDYTSSHYDTSIQVETESSEGALKPNGRTLTWTETSIGGTAVFTNTRQTAEVTVKKVLEGVGTEMAFTYSGSYTLTEDGKTTTTQLKDITVTSGSDGVAFAEKIPTGAVLSVTEKVDDSYNIETSAASGASDQNTDPKSFTFAVSGDDTVTYKNTLKTYPVKIVLVDQDGNAGVQARFTLPGIFSDRYTTGTNNTVFETGRVISGTAQDKELAVGEYTLNEIWLQEHYLGLSAPVAIHVTGTGVSIDEMEGAALTKDGDVYVLTITNRKTVPVTVKKVLEDPLLTSSVSTFTFSASYELNGKTVKLNDFQVISGLSASVEVPVGAKLTITEKLNATAAATYDTRSLDADGAKQEGVTYTKAEITDATEVTFTNARKTVVINLTKLVVSEEEADLAQTFSFEVKLGNGALPIKAYTLYDDEDDSKDLVTSDQGVVTLSLGHNGTQAITVPIGSTLTITEAETETDFEITTTSLAGHTDGDPAENIFKLDKPLKGDTITFTNTNSGKDITFRKIDGDGNGLSGAAFTLYDTYEHAASKDSTGVVQVRVGTSKVSSFSSDGEGSVTFKVANGVYYMRETTPPGGYQVRGDVFRVIVGKAKAAELGVTLPEGKDYLLQLMKDSATADSSSDLSKTGLVNVTETTRKVILKKINESWDGLQGAAFTLTRLDGSVISGFESLTSNEKGILYIGDLPLGTYYLTETIVPNGYKMPDGPFKIEVRASGVTVTATANT